MPELTVPNEIVAMVGQMEIKLQMANQENVRLKLSIARAEAEVQTLRDQLAAAKNPPKPPKPPKPKK